METNTAQLKQNQEKLQALLSPCRLCPRRCGVDRLAGKRGLCGGGLLPSLATTTLHFGEEPVLTGSGGSGTLFFAGCALHCCYCQNHQISTLQDRSTSQARELEIGQLAQQFLQLQAQGAHNINLVTPTHFTPQIAAALILALEQGLTLPVVYNSSGYEEPQVLSLMAPFVDLFLPDLKWLSTSSGERLASAPDYGARALYAVERMVEFKGPLAINRQGLATRGVLVRHLVLPGGLSDSLKLLTVLAPALQRGVGLSLMAQYNPPHPQLPPPLNRPLTPDEYYPVVYELRQLNPPIAFIQDLNAAKVYNPDFTRPDDLVFAD